MITRTEILDRLSLAELRVEELKTAIKLFDEKAGTLEKVYFHYINYEKKYKFTTLKMLGTGTYQGGTWAVAKCDFDKCRYLNIGDRKCDIFNDSHLAGLRKVHEESEKVHANINAIKKGEY